MSRPSHQDPPDNPHAAEPQAITGALGVDPAIGLSEEEVRRRRQRHGPNQLRRRRSNWSILLRQFKSIVILVLVGALALAIAFAQWPEAAAVAAVIVINTGIAFVSESRAAHSMEALHRLGRHNTMARRQGAVGEIAAADLVPGDVLVLQAEALVPADARVLDAEGCRVNESALTGESAPVDKRAQPVDEDAPLAERPSMLYKGTTIVDGRVDAVVVATGMATELGRISELTESAEATAAPLQQRLDHLCRRLALIVLVITALVAGAGLLAGREPMLMIETAIALGVAAIPEGLPIVATLALARGMWVMARRHALINRLPAVETLGATRVIFTDKTGTLTENRMTLRRIITPAGDHELHIGKRAVDMPDDPVARRLVEAIVLCNNATLGDDAPPESARGEGDRGDPTEIALLRAGAALGARRGQLLESEPEVREVGFDPDVKMMATYHRATDGFRVAVKGAPRAVLEVCDRLAAPPGKGSSGPSGPLADDPLDDQTRADWRSRADALAADGLRLLAVADKVVSGEEEEPYRRLRLLGLVGLLDPAREDVRDAVDTCQRAGIKVAMVTGDQAGTARAIARAAGLVGDTDDPELRIMRGDDLEQAEEGDGQRNEILRCNVFARVSPAQKLNLISIYQDAGETVAMTGDGVNDAPALKKADIGIAMGQRGSDAAKEAADMVLTDDAFASIVAAVEQGRAIFDNIRKSVLFMLCTNIAEVLAVSIASVTHLPIPLRPLQILYLNVLTDVFPALALAVTRSQAGVMDRPPRAPKEPILTGSHWFAIGAWSALIGACVLGALITALRVLQLDEMTAVTVSFLTLGLAKLWFVFNLREPGISPLRSPIVRNPWIWGAIGLCAVLLAGAVYLPGLSDFLEARDPGPAGWAVAGGFSLAVLAAGQLYLMARAARARRS